MEEKFTYKELQTIIDALEDWENKSDGLVGALIGSMFAGMAGDDPDKKAELEKAERERRLKEEEEKMRRKKISTKIKSKVYEMMDNAQVSEIESLNGKVQ